MSDASFAGPRQKVERAIEHISDLGTRIERFFQSRPYEITVQDNAASGQREWIVTRAAPLPTDISIVAGDAIHNLRSALDHLIWQLVVANGGEPDQIRTEFPVWRSESHFKSSRPGNAKGISKEALDVLYELKPYKGGNDNLWQLHKLDIVDKHRLLLAVACGFQSFTPPNTLKAHLASDPNFPGDVDEMPDFLPIGIRPADSIVVEKGAVLLGAPLEDESHDDTRFNLEVALYEPESKPGEPLLKALHGLCDFTDEILNRFAALLPH